MEQHGGRARLTCTHRMHADFCSHAPNPLSILAHCLSSRRQRLRLPSPTAAASDPAHARAQKCWLRCRGCHAARVDQSAASQSPLPASLLYAPLELCLRLPSLRPARSRSLWLGLRAATCSQDSDDNTAKRVRNLAVKNRESVEQRRLVFPSLVRTQQGPGSQAGVGLGWMGGGRGRPAAPN